MTHTPPEPNPPLPTPIATPVATPDNDVPVVNNPSNVPPANAYYHPYTWAAHLYDELPRQIQLARKVLEKWFWRLENGTAERYKPNPREAAIPKDKVDEAIRRLDTGFEYEQWTQSSYGGYNGQPDFHRLKAPQRQAMCQELRRCLRGYTHKFVHWHHLPEYKTAVHEQPTNPLYTPEPEAVSTTVGTISIYANTTHYRIYTEVTS